MHTVCSEQHESLMNRGDGRNAISIYSTNFLLRKGTTRLNICQYVLEERITTTHEFVVLSRPPARYFKEEMTARNVYVIRKLRWDRSAHKNVASALKDYNQTGGRKYDFPESVSASHAVGDL